MKKFIITLIVAIAATCIAVAVMAFKFEPKIVPNTVVGLVPVGGLTKAEAAKKLRIWWESVKGSEIVLKSKLLGNKPLVYKTNELGISVDDAASVDTLPMDDMWERAAAAVSSNSTNVNKFDVVFKVRDDAMPRLKEDIEDLIGGRRPARVFYKEGVFERVPEVTGFTLDEEGFKKLIPAAITAGESIDIPLIEAEKSVPDEQLEQISEVVSEFSTRFPVRQASRNTNLKAASGRIDGIVLAPGEKFSFNGAVGRRTLQNGFKIAGVYKNGKHDTGIGGGICQVSSTLYNAALFANLKIVRRQNHSMPVAYLPVGRDATVDYGAIDLVFENSYDTPIAVSTAFKPGRLTFRILGKKDPTLSVKIENEGHKSWNPGAKTIVDKTLAAGKTKIVEKGSLGHSVKTYRYVYKDGQLVKKEYLGQSYYKGGVRITATGSKAAKPAQTIEVETPEQPEVDE